MRRGSLPGERQRLVTTVEFNELHGSVKGSGRWNRHVQAAQPGHRDTDLVACKDVARAELLRASASPLTGLCAFLRRGQNGNLAAFEHHAAHRGPENRVDAIAACRKRHHGQCMPGMQQPGRSRGFGLPTLRPSCRVPHGVPHRCSSVNQLVAAAKTKPAVLHVVRGPQTGVSFKLGIKSSIGRSPVTSSPTV